MLADIDAIIQKSKNRVSTQKKLKYAITIGKIHRPEHCNRCKKYCKPEGHHPDYTKPYDVIWLCHSCHSKIPRETRKHLFKRNRKNAKSGKLPANHLSLRYPKQFIIPASPARIAILKKIGWM